MEPSGVNHFETAADFRVWLEKHHNSASELWVGYWKKATGRVSVTWEETVDEALCFGWIDAHTQADRRRFIYDSIHPAPRPKRLEHPEHRSIRGTV